MNLFRHLPLKLVCSLTPILISAFALKAHEPSYINHPSELKVKASLNLRNSSVADEESAWLMPGINLGNEALPPSKGANIDDIQILGRLNLDDNYYLGSKLGFHQHGNAGELSLENFWLGKYLRFDSGILRINAGKMSSNVTDLANYHPSQDLYSSTPLLAQTFFGGHHRDVGLNVSWFASPIIFGESPEQSIGFAKIEIGLEAWNGSKWPYDSGNGNHEGNWSLFTKYHGELYSLKTDFGVWYSTGTAKNRGDNRYESDHHNTDTIAAPNALFSGEIRLFGGFAELSRTIKETDNHVLSWHSHLEWIQMQQDGDLVNTNQSAQMTQTLDGYSLQLGLNLQQGQHHGAELHKLFVKHEMLVVDNNFTDATSTFLAEHNLVNEGFEPSRTSLVYLWQWRPNFTVRVETFIDNTQLQPNADATTNLASTGNDSKTRTEQIWSLGLLWQHNLL
ncbi:MAG: hypothetical protein HWE10_01130 [Gammaproteobacteria bacterium]|nr:hypothetical protein [Gammaproteobacteria bacterium]